MATNNPTFEDRILPSLSRLAHKLIDHQSFSYLESIANFLGALKSGRWKQLPFDEQDFWLERVDGLLGVRALGEDLEFERDPDRLLVSEIISAQRKAIKKLI